MSSINKKEDMQIVKASAKSCPGIPRSIDTGRAYIGQQMTGQTSDRSGI